MRTSPLVHVFHWIVCLIFAVSTVTGLWISGSPSTERERKFDRQRISHLVQLSYAIDTYVNTHANKLPENLEQVRQLSGYPEAIRDLETNEPYEYRITGANSYELCAVFSLPSSAEDQMYQSPRMIHGQETRWEHLAGRSCFQLQADYQPTLQTAPKPTS